MTDADIERAKELASEHEALERYDEFLEAMNLLGAKDGETLLDLAHRISERVRELEESYLDGYEIAAESAAQICEQQADAVDGRLPDATGGKFAKKFAANGLRGAAGLIRALKRYAMQECK